MEHDAELTTNSSAPRLLPSTCAVTVNVDGLGLRSLTIPLRETESDELIRNRLLTIDARNDPYAVREALHQLLDATFNPTP